MKINDIDIRIQQTLTLPVETNNVHYKLPSTAISKKEIEKRVYNICKNNNAVCLHILSNSEENSDEKTRFID